MKIGILEAGLINDKLKHRFDPYPLVFERFLGRAGADLEVQGYSVVRGEFPASINECDGWLITGSRHGVYEKTDWMQRLEDFVRQLATSEAPLVGICFGHQIIAQALGGEVVKSDKGWGIGLHSYRLEQEYSWMQQTPAQVGIYAFHQDQVVKCPPGAQVFASSDFCPIAGLSYGESIISLQAHPEFEAEYEFALLDLYQGNIVPDDVALAARQSMETGKLADSQLLAQWLVQFLISRQRPEQALPGSRKTAAAQSSG